MIGARAHQQLADHGTARARHLTGVLRTHWHVAPPERDLALGGDRALDEALQPLARARGGGQEAHQHPVAAGRRKLEVHRRAQQLMGHLHEDPGAVPGARVRAGRATVLEILERGDRQRDHLVRGPVVQARDHPDAARVVLESRVVQSDRR